MKTIRNLLLVTTLLTTAIQAQVPNDGIPEPDRNNLEYRLIPFNDENNNITFEYIGVPTLIRDFGRVGFVESSPNDPNRNFSSLPNFTLARWHWWLFGFEVLARAQRQFAEVIGEIKGHQKQCGDKIMIDDPISPFYNQIITIREYLVPFEPVQTTNLKYAEYFLANTQEQITHADAAISSINLTVANRGLFEGIATDYQKRAETCVVKRIEETICKEIRAKLRSTRLRSPLSVCKGVL